MRIENREQVFLSIVIYAHNCQDVIAHTLQSIDKFIQEKFRNYELIVVNDASTDQTSTQLSGINQKLYGQLIMIELVNKHGTEIAMQAALDSSIGDLVIEIDEARLNFPVELLWDLYQECTKNSYDLVSAKPSRQYALSSNLFYTFLKSLTPKDLDLTTERCRILTRRTLNAASRIKDKCRYRKIVYRFVGCSYSIIEFEPVGKISKTASAWERGRLAMEILFTYTNVGMRINITLSLIFLLFSLLLGVYALYVYLKQAQAVAGWTSLMIFLSFGFSGVFLVLGIVSKYLQILLREIRTFPLYTVKSVQKFENYKSSQENITNSDELPTI